MRRSKYRTTIAGRDERSREDARDRVRDALPDDDRDSAAPRPHDQVRRDRQAGIQDRREQLRGDDHPQDVHDVGLREGDGPADRGGHPDALEDERGHRDGEERQRDENSDEAEGHPEGVADEDEQARADDRPDPGADRAHRLARRYGPVDVRVRDDASADRDDHGRRQDADHRHDDGGREAHRERAGVVLRGHRTGHVEREPFRLRREQHERAEDLDRDDDRRRDEYQLREAGPVQRDRGIEDLPDSSRSQIRHHASTLRKRGQRRRRFRRFVTACG